jgi:hypothetical protein
LREPVAEIVPNTQPHKITSNFNHFQNAGLRMPGVFEVPNTVSIGRAIDNFLLLVECSFEGEWEGQIRYLPL